MKITVSYFIPFLIAITFIMAYGKFRCNHPNYKDPLETRITEDFDGWSLTHFFLFMYVGHIRPDTFFFATLIGILWELFEHYYGEKRPGWLGGYGDCEMRTDRQNDNWWYGKYSDIVANSLGFFIGSQIPL